MSPVATDEPTAPLVYQVPVAARLLGISPAHYYDLFRRGQVPGRRLGKRVVVPILQLQRYLDGEEWT